MMMMMTNIFSTVQVKVDDFMKNSSSLAEMLNQIGKMAPDTITQILNSTLGINMVRSCF